jgi:Raf kinase inhibitor-like YbhB/YbcL family protein
MVIRCPSIDQEGVLPVRCVRAGTPGSRNVSPALEWSDPPEGTGSFALTIIDRHPIAHDWVHWCVVDIPASVRVLAEGASGGSMPAGSREMGNTFGDAGYGGPQPPRGTGPHDYHITIHALRVPTMHGEARAKPEKILSAISSAEIASASVVGLFESR